MDKKSEISLMIENFLNDEKIGLCLKNEISKISERNQLVCFDWIRDICMTRHLKRPISKRYAYELSLAIQFFVRYLTKQPIVDTKNYQLLSCACIMIAEHSCLTFSPTSKLFADYLQNAYTQTEIDDFVLHVLVVLDFKVYYPTIYDFLECMVGLELLVINNNVLNIILCSYTLLMSNHDFSCIKPSLQLAGLLFYLGEWTDQIATCLHITYTSAITCAFKISTYISEVKADLKNMHLNCVVATPFREVGGVGERVCCDDVSQYVHSESKYIPYNEFQDQFKMIEQVGSGSFSTVYTYTDTVTDTVVCVKSVLVRDQPGLFRIICEIGSLQYLSGLAGIEKFYGYSYERTDVFTTFKIIIKKYNHTIINLFSYISDNGTKVCLLRDCLRMILQGSMNMTTRGLVHVDLRCENIMVDDSNCVIVDFGVVNRIKTKNESMCPMEYCKAPECLYNIYHRESDIWIIGTSITRLFIVDGSMISIHRNPNPYFYDVTTEYDITSESLHTEIYTDINQSKEFNVMDVNDLKTGSIFVRKLKTIDEDLGDLVSHMLCRIEDRWTAAKLLTHKFFTQHV